MGLMVPVLLGVGFLTWGPSLDWSFIDSLQPGWFVCALCFSLGNLLCRGKRLSLLADEESSATLFSWTHCAARHQILFSLLPSAAGDLGFPYLCNKICSVDYKTGTRIVAQYRLQDLVALVALFALGFALYLEYMALAFTVCLFIPVAFYWSEAIASRLMKTLLHFVTRLRFFEGATIAAKLRAMTKVERVQSVSATQRALSAILTISNWAIASAMFWCLFKMVDQELGVGTILLVVAGLNLFGMFNALTVGGLGIGESALATILIYLGYDYKVAVATALVVRPCALVVTIVACLLLELAAPLVVTRGRFSLSSAKP